MRDLRFWLMPAAFLAVALLLLTGSVDSQRAGARTKPDNSSTGTEKHGFDISNMDTSVSACDNFFQYANGGWVKQNPVPAAYPAWGSFSQLAERNREHVRDILEDAAKKKAPAGSEDQKIGDFYASCMDEDAIEAAGIRPIQPELDRIKAINSQAALQQEIARLQSRGIGVLFRFGSGQDLKDSKQVIGQLNQGGLSLPDRDYYLKDDADSKRIRDKFQPHVAKMFQLA